ncbi:MAG: adenosine kinase [Candidatus Marinimicrobia bacterium]|nr:adenosine kinase [Candidatus Neomarinimicrobiota bacterium]MBL7010931.1 adenosine kinase [Candidatus Neomarinimicrobiota bacterium]MBL7031416.1 adenosine kinase [Candidatus Neomarinimicrobiota bacterium]
MKLSTVAIFGIGNPLIDVVINVEDHDLKDLGVKKGIMHLVDENRQKELMNYFNNRLPIFHPGGSAPNTLLACAGLGIQGVISGKIGNDAFGEIYQAQVEKYGINSRLVISDGPTGSSIILVTPDGERTMNTHLGMCQDFSIADIDESLLAKADIFYFTGYMWDTESQKSAITHALSIAKDNRIKVIFDVADPFAVHRYRDAFLTLIEEEVDVVFANQAELSILFDTENIEKATKSLGRIANMAAVKLGKKGCYVIEKGDLYKISSRPIIAKDSTGAGDMFAAGFMAALSKGYRGKTAGEIGGYLAEEIIQIPGAQFEKSVIKQINKELPWPIESPN